MSVFRAAFCLLALAALPLTVHAADADWVSIDTEDSIVYYYQQGGSRIEAIDFPDSVMDIQAMRITRQDTSYIVILTKTYQKLRLDVYDFSGQRLRRTVAREVSDPYRLGSVRLEYVRVNDKSYIQIRYIRMDDSTDQPITYQRKRYTVTPTKTTPPSPLRNAHIV